MTTTISTVPPLFVMATTEELPFGFDTTNLLGLGQTPSAPSSVLVDVNTGLTIALTGDAPSVVGNVVTQIVDGALLIAGHSFTLSVTFTVSADTTWTMVLTINCPQ